jgi:hypothetical protein
MLKHLCCACTAAFLFGCGSSDVTKQEDCGRFALRAAGGDRSFTAADLVAHAAAMGMTQQETETLLYLEGVSPKRQSICIDAKHHA